MTETTRETPPGVPANMITPTGNVPAIGVPNTQDYARLIFSAPYFETIAIAEIIQPSVTEAVENALPSLIPPYVDAAVLAGVQQYSVLLTGSTMSGPLFLSPLMPTQPSQAATMAYVDAMLATAGIPEVPPVPSGQIWGRETGQWVPISQSEGTFLPLSGGTMGGIINMSGNTITNMAAVPAMPNGAAPAQWVLNQIASVSLYQGTWDADTNAPDLTQLSVRVNGYTWIALTSSPSGVVIGPAIPGLQGMTIYNGDTIIYSTVAGQFQAIHAGGLTLPEADARYVQLAGSQMSGALLLNADASQNMQAVTYQQLEAAVANTVTPDAPADGQAYLRVGVGTNRWVPGLPLAGGILTGPITLSGNATAALNPVPLQQMTSAITASTAGLLPIAGGTMTGPIILAGNAASNLNPVPLQQVNSMLATYALAANVLALNGGTMTGPITLAGNAAAALQAVPLQQLNTSLGGYLPLTGGTLSGNLSVGGVIALNATSGAINANGNITAGAGLNSTTGFALGGGGTMGGPGCEYTGVAPGGHYFAFIYNGGNPNLFVDGGNVGYWVLSTSDLRLKSHITDISRDCLAAINAIALKQFDMESGVAGDEPRHWDVGYIAQEVAEIMPDAVPPAFGDGPLGVDLRSLCAHLIGAVQQLSGRLDALETRA